MNQYGNLLSQFQVKERLCFTRGDYTVKTVSTDVELIEVLKLRYQIFQGEFIQNNKNFVEAGLDFDRYDILGDHLIIKDNRTDKIVGCYRLICSEYSNLFYSQSEFYLNPFLKLPGTKLELSRACVHKNYRNGMVIHLLWRGLAQYIQQARVKYMFGCASIQTMNPWKIALIHHHLDNMGRLDRSLGVYPVREYEIRGFENYSNYIVNTATPTRSERRAEIAKNSLPALFNAYLRAGAKVLGRPAIDKAFKCADFLTVLNTDSLTAQIEKKYQVT